LIKELIVVEGKNDAHAVRRALGDVDILWTEGFGLSKEKLEVIKAAARHQGVIVFTDPDTIGERIRERIRRFVPEAKHVYLSKADALCDGDVGVEHASPGTIREAFKHVQAYLNPEQGPQGERDERFTMDDLLQAGLIGAPDSGRKRSAVGRRLGIGDANGKQFLKRLNSFGISRESFKQALEEIMHEKT